MFSWWQTLQKRYPLTKMYPFYKSDGTRELLVVTNKRLFHDVQGQLFYASDQLYDGIDTDINNAPETLASNSAKFLTYKDRNINDVVLIADGGKLKAYDGKKVSEVV